MPVQGVNGRDSDLDPRRESTRRPEGGRSLHPCLSLCFSCHSCFSSHSGGTTINVAPPLVGGYGYGGFSPFFPGYGFGGYGFGGPALVVGGGSSLFFNILFFGMVASFIASAFRGNNSRKDTQDDEEDDDFY